MIGRHTHTHTHTHIHRHLPFLLPIPWKSMVGVRSQKCRPCFPSFVVFLRHSIGCRQACWLMHQESPSGNSSNRPLFLMSNCCQPCVICPLIFTKGTGFVVPEFVDSDFPRPEPPPPPRIVLILHDVVIILRHVFRGRGRETLFFQPLCGPICEPSSVLRMPFGVFLETALNTGPLC